VAIPSVPGGQEPDTNNLPEAEPPVVSAVIPGRLAAPAPPGTVAHLRDESWWKRASEVGSDWQTVSPLADFWELALVPPVQPGRGRELAGLIAGAGEQLALGLAALVEAELWRLYRRETPTDTLDLDEMSKRGVHASQEMGHRAMAELATYYLLATGHTLANVTVRTLALDSQLHPTLLDSLGGWCPVGSSDPKDWLSLNRDTARTLRRIARKTDSPAFQGLAEPASALVLSPDWQEVDRLRGAYYHRRRPQSAGIAGVPLASPWVFSAAVMSMEFGGDEYVDGDNLAHNTADLGRRVLSAVASAMQTLLERVEAAVAEMRGQRDRLRGVAEVGEQSGESPETV
jgi:hypothetical protein